jgi:O-antigen ligase
MAGTGPEGWLQDRRWIDITVSARQDGDVITADNALSSARTVWSNRFDRVAAAVLYIGAVAVPVVFVPNSDDVFVEPKTILVRLLIVGAAITAGVSLVLGRRPLLIRFPDVAVVVFILLTAVATLTSVDPLTSLHGEQLQRAGFISFAAIAAGYLVARTTIASIARLQMLMTAVAIGASVVAFYGLVQWWGFDPIWDVLPNGRVIATVGQPNWLGAYLVITIPVTIAVSFTARSRIARIGLAVSAVAQATVLVTTLSRASWLGLVTAAIFAATLIIAKAWSRGAVRMATVSISAAAGVVAVLALLVVTGPLANTNPVERALSATNLDAFDIRQHLALWEVGAAITADHPLIGTGPDTYAIVFPAYRDDVIEPYYADYLSQFRPESPHNVYLAVAAGAGLVALCSLLVAFAGGLAIVARAARKHRSGHILLISVTAAGVGHLITDAFMTMDVATTSLMWVLLAGGIAIDSHNTAEAHRTAISTDRV